MPISGRKYHFFVDAVSALCYIVCMITKTARVQQNVFYKENEQARYVVVFEEKLNGYRIDLQVKHYANEKTAQRAANKYTEAA